MTITTESWVRNSASGAVTVPYVMTVVPDFIIVTLNGLSGTPVASPTITFGGVGGFTRLATTGTGSGPAGSQRVDIEVWVLDTRLLTIPASGVIAVSAGVPVIVVAIRGITELTFWSSNNGTAAALPIQVGAPGVVTFIAAARRTSPTLDSDKTDFGPVTSGSDNGGILAMRPSTDATDFAWTPATAITQANIVFNATPRRKGQYWPRGGNMLRAA